MSPGCLALLLSTPTLSGGQYIVTDADGVNRTRDVFSLPRHVFCRGIFFLSASVKHAPKNSSLNTQPLEGTGLLWGIQRLLRFNP